MDIRFDQTRPAELSGAEGDLLTEIPQPQHAGAVALYRLWQELTPTGGLPARDDFTFERLGALGILGNFFVVEPLDGGRDWRYRLLGTHITWLFGADVTNVPFTRHFDETEAALCIRLSNRVAQTRQPVFLVGSFRTGDFSGRLETMSLPVLGRDGAAVWLIGASFPSTRP
ncbi:PAS domain-containing protein [Ferrovibrio xuzhouensis]|uniref:PAS domain-containing protein n=1 Tax=Ferrovibrio xuzhouensis TaxID=1576914 RepID=A0ABV7VJK1_9PROT